MKPWFYSVPFPTTLNCYKVQKFLGKGAFGKVALAIHKLSDKPVAFKIIEKDQLKGDQYGKVLAEIKLLAAMRHKNIIRLLEVFETSN